MRIAGKIRPENSARELAEVGVRGWINQKQSAGAIVGVLLLAGAALAIFRETRPETPPLKVETYFSDDDGKTWFSDGVSNLPPYDHNGKQAVRCFVFEHNGQPFVAYLEKYSDTLRSKIQNSNGATDSDLMFGTLVKRPGDPYWIPTSDPRSQLIIKPRAPDGSTDNIQPYGD